MTRLALMVAFVGALACAGERDAYDGEMQGTPGAFDTATTTTPDTAPATMDTMMTRDTMTMGDTVTTP